MFSRREMVSGAAAALVALTSRPAISSRTKGGFSSALPGRLLEIEAESAGRLGVAVLDMASGQVSGIRGDERFPLCSTFKLLAVSAVLARVDQAKEKLDRRLQFDSRELVAYSPVTEKHIGDRGMKLGELCEAAVTLSDNTAGNLLLRALGGPRGVTAFARSLGDKVTRLDRSEPDLNEAAPGDPRDTTSPNAMLANLRAVTLGDALSPASRGLLTAWMVGCKTGARRLREGLPADWRIGDKTGTGGRGTSNDIGVAWPPGRVPVVIVAYLTGSTRTEDERNQTLAEVGKAVASHLT